MEIIKSTIHSSPFIGVFALATEKHVLLPNNVEKKEERRLGELFNAETVKTRLAESPLIGVLAVGNSSGIVVSGIVEEKEISHLKEKGLRVKRLAEATAIGNLVELNDSKGFCSKVVQQKTKQEIEGFLHVELKYAGIANAEVVGSSIVLTNNGFIVNPSISSKEFKELEEWVKLSGNATTANLGDVFVGNSVIANSSGAVVGSYTTGHELMRIDQGLRGAMQ